jgi:deoxyribonuclease-4
MMLGAHMSIAKGLHLSFQRGSDIGCRTMQIFTKNASQWRERVVTDEEVHLFKEAQEETGIRPVVAHDSYLINLASPDETMRRKSIEAFIGELERAERLGLTHLVTHPGSHGGAGREDGIKRFAQSVNMVHRRLEGYRVKIAFETTAGQGSSLGYRFEHIGNIMEMIEDRTRCAVCLDTAHIFAAGYDIRSREGLENTLEEFDELIGLDKLEVIHINDSKKELGSRVDRHQHIGEGFLGLETFRNILHHPALKGLPFILETPMKDGGHAKNLQTLRRLAGE